MNVKINKENFEYLTENYQVGSYVFGSRLHGIAKEDSDKDYIIVLNDRLYLEFSTLAVYLPNFHSYQYDDSLNNTQYVLMTESQFYKNLFSGDGNMVADVVLLNEDHPDHKDRLFLCRTYKIIKGYLGVAKRDLKLHGNSEKKRFHAYRSLYMAETLMSNNLPSKEGIIYLKDNLLPSKEILWEKEIQLRGELNKMLYSSQIDLYPSFKESSEVIQIMTNSNNIREFRYE